MSRNIKDMRIARTPTLPIDPFQTYLEVHQDNLAPGLKSTGVSSNEILSSGPGTVTVTDNYEALVTDMIIYANMTNKSVTMNASKQIGSSVKIWKISDYDGDAVTVLPGSGITIEGLSELKLYGKYSFVELERISETVFAIKDLSDFTFRASSSFTLPAMPDGARKRILNTHATNAITVTAYSGTTIEGQSTMTLSAGHEVEIELIGTDWRKVVLSQSVTPSAGDVMVWPENASGTFNPELSFTGGSTGITYAARSGVWQKIGNRVDIGISMLLSSKGSSTGQIRIGTLPVPCGGTKAKRGSFNVFGKGISCTGRVYGICTTVNTSNILLVTYTDSGVETVLDNTDIADTVEIFLNGSYFV